MSFSKFKIGELRQIAEDFGVEVPSKTNREGIALLLEEEGVTYGMYEKFANAEREDVDENILPQPSINITNSQTVLVRMERMNPTYQVGRYTFTQQHPFIAMPEWEAQAIFDLEQGFRLANPREAQEYYS
jgi:hypothetical protein